MPTTWVKTLYGCIRLGNPDLDFQNLNLDFPIEREIRKRISPPRNPSSGWISIKKSKSGFLGFPFLSFDWEIRKRICKTVLVNSGLLFTNYACACKTALPKNSFANPFSDFPIERQKGKSKKSRFGFLNWNPPWGRISRRWNPFSDFAFDWEIQI